MKSLIVPAVLEWVYEEIRTQERKLNLEGLPPERAIKQLIESSFDHLARHPDFIVLLNDENRNGARHVRASRKLEDMHSPLVSMVSKILKEGVRAGAFRKGVNPVHLYISIAGLSYFFFSNTPTLSAIFGKDLSSTAARRTRRKHVVDLAQLALADRDQQIARADAGRIRRAAALDAAHDQAVALGQPDRRGLGAQHAGAR